MEMENDILEVCVDSTESALAAQEGGASRLELCGNLVIGGTSPSPCLFQEVQAAVKLPVHILIRPRYGDFCYTEHEFHIMLKEIEMFQDLGAPGGCDRCAMSGRYSGSDTHEAADTGRRRYVCYPAPGL